MYTDDRPDIELERDRMQGIARDNYYFELNKSIPDQPFATEPENAFKISEIVKRLIRQGGGRALYYNHQIYWDMDLEEARAEATLDVIIPEGWDEPITDLDQVQVDGHAPGMHEYEIMVKLSES